jgi:Tol biopolymer transport system component
VPDLSVRSGWSAQQAGTCIESPVPHSKPAGRAGRRLEARSCSNRTNQLCLIRPDGTHVRQLTHLTGLHGTFAPAWSPDGTRIVFTGNQRFDPLGPRNDLYTMRSDGTDVTRIISNRSDVMFSDWGPAVASTATAH